MQEYSLIFGSQEHLIGTVTSPTPQDSNSDWMILLTNAGVIPRVGPHRINVQIARAFARLGVSSLRFDTSGLGDSRRPDSILSANEQFVADTRAAMDVAQVRYGCKQFAMIGFCSGADIAHMTALEDERLRAVVLFDSYVYPTLRAKIYGLIHRIRRYGAFTMLGKLLRYPFRKRRQNTSSVDSNTTPSEGPVIFGRARVPAHNVFGERIRTLVDRGVKIFFIYSGGEPLWYNYHGQFRDTFGRFGFVDKVAYEFLSRSDHTVTQPHARQAVIDLAIRWWQQEVHGGRSTTKYSG